MLSAQVEEPGRMGLVEKPMPEPGDDSLDRKSTRLNSSH
jgi:hypothetical protein